MIPTRKPVCPSSPTTGTKVIVGAMVASFSLAGLSGCVLPEHSVSGLEISWQVAEGNEADGEDPIVIRSCEGGLVTDVNVQIDDVDDDERSASYAFDCDEGFRTSAELFLSLGDIFVELRAGTYRVRTEAIDDPSKRGATGAPVVVASTDDEVDLSSSGATLAHFGIVPAPVNMVFDLRSVDACQTLQARIEYADEENDIVAIGLGTDLSSYRAGLISNRGFALDDQAQACADLGGLHSFELVDRGEYRVVLTLDGTRTCETTITHDGRTGVFALDLALLGC